MSAEITIHGVLDMQVCVPADWADTQVLDFANQENPTGLTNGWTVRRQGDKLLCGDAERTPCSEKTGHVHLVLDC